MSTIDERGKQVITELEIRSAVEGDILRIDEDAKLTPLAEDIARERGISDTIIRTSGRTQPKRSIIPTTRIVSRGRSRAALVISEL